MLNNFCRRGRKSCYRRLFFYWRKFSVFKVHCRLFSSLEKEFQFLSLPILSARKFDGEKLPWLETSYRRGSLACFEFSIANYFVVWIKFREYKLSFLLIFLPSTISHGKSFVRRKFHSRLFSPRQFVIFLRRRKFSLSTILSTKKVCEWYFSLLIISSSVKSFRSCQSSPPKKVWPKQFPPDYFSPRQSFVLEKFFTLRLFLPRKSLARISSVHYYCLFLLMEKVFNFTLDYSSPSELSLFCGERIRVAVDETLRKKFSPD